jgi:hypothetical protein
LEIPQFDSVVLPIIAIFKVHIFFFLFFVPFGFPPKGGKPGKWRLPPQKKSKREELKYLKLDLCITV